MKDPFLKLEINYADIVPKGRGGGIMYGDIQSQIQIRV